MIIELFVFSEVYFRFKTLLHRIEDVLGRLNSAKYFSSLDGSRRTCSENCLHHTGLTIWIFVPANRSLWIPSQLSTSHGSSLTDRVLHGLKQTELLCYMDDLLVFGSNFEEHQSGLNNVLTILGGRLSDECKKKCIFTERNCSSRTFNRQRRPPPWPCQDQSHSEISQAWECHSVESLFRTGIALS